MVSIAHQAVIESSTVGDFTFFGSRSRSRNCESGEGAIVMHTTIMTNMKKRLRCGTASFHALVYLAVPVLSLRRLIR